MDKKSRQLGMNISTAQHRLRMDILFNLASEAGHRCYRCGGALCRETFSIEHKEPWLDSPDPSGKFFDPSNLAFSHRACNYAAARRTNRRYSTEQERLAGQREMDARRRSSGRRTETKRLWRQKRRDNGLAYT